MNKDLPLIIRKVFSNLDPLIWYGTWLYTLNTLLDDQRMVSVWEEFVIILKDRHAKGSSLPINQYMKWELKAFIAQVVKFKSEHRDTSNKSKELSGFLANYFKKKEIRIDKNHNLIKTTSEIICASAEKTNN